MNEMPHFIFHTVDEVLPGTVTRMENYIDESRNRECLPARGERNIEGLGLPLPG